MSDTYVAIGYDVSDTEIKRNGKVRNFGKHPDYKSAYSAWLYTHRLHDGNATISEHGTGNCPAHGQFAVVKEGKT